jgi:trimeric autotransporter adhesin
MIRKNFFFFFACIGLSATVMASELPSSGSAVRPAAASIPRVTQQQRMQLTSLPAGTLVCQVDAVAEGSGLYFFTGKQWTKLSVVSSLPEVTVFANGNTAQGDGALAANASGINNSAFGERALNKNATGSNNTAVGMLALVSNARGGGNVAVGFQSLKSSTADGNVALGAYSLEMTTGGFNTAAGLNALRILGGGVYNAAYGYDALARLTGGSHRNIAIGSTAGSNLTSGDHNVLLGSASGSNLRSGSNNILIGQDAQASAATVSNEVTIGNARHTSYRMYAASWTNVSDQRAKHDIQDLPEGLSLVTRLRPVEFVYNNAPAEEKSLGFVAQEVKAALEDSKLKESNLVTRFQDDLLGLKTTELIPVLTKAIQEQQLIINDLQQQINDLKNHPRKKRK